MVIIRFGHDYDPTCMQMDETLYGISEKIKNFAVTYLVDITEVPDFNKVRQDETRQRCDSMADLFADTARMPLALPDCRCTSCMTLAQSCSSTATNTSWSILGRETTTRSTGP